MTVPSTISRSGPYDGNDVTTDFPYNFRILDETHIRVVITDPDNVETDADPSDYSVSGVGDASGTVTYGNPDPLPTGYKLTILRNVPLTQLVDIANAGGFYPETHEDVFDKLTMAVQQVAEEVARSVKVQASSDTDPDELIAEIVQAVADAEAAAETAAQDAVDAADATLTGYVNQAQAILDDFTAFEQLYLGASAGNPTTDNDGGPLQVGMLYFNTGSESLRVYSGGGWVDPETDVSTKIFYFLAGAGDTSVSGVDENGLTLAYSAGSLIVVLNGSVLIPGVDYVATTGTSITGITAMSLNDEVQVYAFNGVPVSGLEGPANLSDVPDKAAARTNLDVYSTDEVDDLLADIDVPVTSVAGKTGAVTLDKNDVGLGNVPNVDTQNADNITSGTLSIARVASGTPDGTKFVRDDGVLAVPTSALMTSGGVGSIVLGKVGALGLAQNATISGASVLPAYFNSGGALTTSLSTSGTWKNIGGVDIGGNGYGLLQRIS